MSSKRKKSLNLLFLFGFGLCILPFILNFVFQSQVSDLISSFNQENASIHKAVLKEQYEKAKAYNQNLFHGLENEAYEDMLNYSSTKVMSMIEIPVISLKLPIYHGVQDSVLNVGIGHFLFSSLPVGTKNSHCVLTGHRGLPNAKLFTRLDELKKNDLIYIYTCNKKMVYKVDQIRVISPEQIYDLTIQKNKDLLSLVTCTPYGINTKRLVVTAIRINPKKNKTLKKVRFSYSFRELCFLIIPIVFLVFGKKVMKA